MADLRLPSRRPLNVGNFDRCLTHNHAGGVSLLDLTEATFVDAYALVGMSCLALSETIEGNSVAVLPPSAGSVANYLSRMGVEGVLRDRCGIHCPLPAVRHAERDDVLVELRWFDAGENLTSLEEMLFNRLHGRLQPQVLSALLESLWELGLNVGYHSRAGGGFVAAQVYGAGQPWERVDLAIGDVGIGILQSLEESGRYSASSDAEAIDLALQFQVSSIDDPGRGVGLPTTLELVTGLNGMMVVRTGTSRLTVTKDRQRDLPTERVQGTIVGVSIPCR